MGTRNLGQTRVPRDVTAPPPLHAKSSNRRATAPKPTDPEIASLMQLATARFVLYFNNRKYLEKNFEENVQDRFLIIALDIEMCIHTC